MRTTLQKSPFFNYLLILFLLYQMLLFSACFPNFESGDGDSSVTPSDCTPTCQLESCGPAEWVRICAGSFLMGSPTCEEGRYEGVETLHSVTLTHHFEMYTTEITQKEYTALMGAGINFNHPDCEHCPADSITWHEAAAYCNVLSREAGFDPCYVCQRIDNLYECELKEELTSPYECSGYRLPTSAEWEYAARAGTTTSTYRGNVGFDEDSPELDDIRNILNRIAWWSANSHNSSQEVASLAPNDWGLYDMLGNINEWCHDGWQGADYDPALVVDPFGGSIEAQRILRGGVYDSEARRIRAANRYYDFPTNRYRANGFRPVRTLH